MTRVRFESRAAKKKKKFTKSEKKQIVTQQVSYKNKK